MDCLMPLSTCIIISQGLIKLVNGLYMDQIQFGNGKLFEFDFIHTGKGRTEGIPIYVLPYK